MLKKNLIIFIIIFIFFKYFEKYTFLKSHLSSFKK